MIMKKSLILTLILLLGMSHAFPFEQEPQCENMTFKPSFAFYGNNRLSVISAGRGYTGIAAEGNLSISNLNPASFNVPYTAQAYYEYGGKNEYAVNEGTSNQVELSNYKAAASYGAAYRVNDKINVGLLYSKTNNYRVDYGSVYNYDCSGLIVIESFDSYEKAAMSIFSVPVSYKLNEMFSLGVGLNTHIYHAETSRVCMNNYNEWENFKGEIDFVLFRPKIGIKANLGENFSLGATFVPPTSKRIKECVCWQEIKYDRNSFPTELAVGSKFNFGSFPLTVLADYHYTNEATNIEFIDKHEASFGIESKILPFMSIRTGYLYQNDYRDMDYVDDGALYWCDDSCFEQNFVTAGTSIKWRKTNFDIAVMHSGFSSDLEQTYLKLGVTLDLEQP